MHEASRLTKITSLATKDNIVEKTKDGDVPAIWKDDDALISVLLEQLASYVQSEVMLVMDTRQQVLNLTRNLELVQAVLADADAKQVKNNSVRLWLQNLKEVVYYADDVLDEWCTRDAISRLQSNVDVSAGFRNKVLSYLLSPCFCLKNVIVHYDIDHQIKDINEQLDGIAKQRTDYGLQVVEVYQNYNESRRLISSVVDVSKIHGREKAKEDIISRLLAESSSQRMALRVISIVGIGGLGKTTLARLIFSEERVVEVFKIKMWVCVSDPFDLVGVAKAIIKEAAEIVPESNVWQEVHKCLCQSVQGKQFLLVLDDVWTEDPNHWNQLKLALDGGAPGSRIIVTTRNRAVAKIMGSVDHDIHDLQKLSDDDSWLVMRDAALVGKEKDLEKFEKMGKEIAIKCKGVPLAITTLANLLCERQTKEEWKDVSKSDLWEMPQIKQFFLPSLFLSYYSLPSITKQCFLYCAIFPKDTELSKSLCIKLWMAQGFFGYEGRRDLESIGEYHFHILAMRSFLQVSKDSDGNITSCKMHDLVRDFAMYLSQNESCCFQDGEKIHDSDKIRHLYAAKVEILHISKAKRLRTLFLGRKSVVPIGLFDKLMCLRTLDMSNCVLEVLPDEVEKLVHLRYLELSDTELLELPEMVCNLYNLQYMGLNRCMNLHKLPENIGKLSNLRHLYIEETDALNYIPKATAALSSLVTLSKFIVSGDDGCTIGGLQLLNNLQGALALNGLSRVTNGKEAIQANLNIKRHLRELTFCFKEDLGEESGARIGMKDVLEKLEPHEDLEIIEISDYSDSQFPNWVQSCSQLTNIVKMSLYRCNECTELPAFGKLASLKTLKIKGMRSVMCIGYEFYGFDAQMTVFPKLDSLVIEDMEKLEEWKSVISNDAKIMPFLRYIKLEKCPMLRSLPCLGSLESLENLSLDKLSSVKYIGNEFYAIDVVRSVGVEIVAFPKLKTLTLEEFDELEEWGIPSSEDGKIMPHLSELRLIFCPKLRALPHIWRVEALEELELERLDSMKEVGVEFVGANEGSLHDGVLFPKLRMLKIREMYKLEEWGVPFITPCLRKLELSNFLKLKTMPTFKKCVKTLESVEIARMHKWEGQEKIVINDQEGSREGDLCVLRSLDIGYCPKLRVVPDYMFSPSLKELELQDDIGVLYDSFPAYGTLCFITKVTLWDLPHSRLPNGFNLLKALQSLMFEYCEILDFDLKELGHFTMLQDLEIWSCPILQKRFKGDNWRKILGHVPKITIDFDEITKKS